MGIYYFGMRHAGTKLEGIVENENIVLAGIISKRVWSGVTKDCGLKSRNIEIEDKHMRRTIVVIFAMTSLLTGMAANATLTNITGCTGANSCDITTTPPNPVSPNPNDGILLAWDEVQNFTLTEALRVDRVFDESAPFISDAGGGDFFIAAGTVVSSHYLQWDPGLGSLTRVQATIELDSQVFAFITADQNLFDSDAALGLPGLDYSDFGLRGLEVSDTTEFNGPNTDINWGASNPGDWTRLISAFSPGAEVPVPFGFSALAFSALSAWLDERKPNQL